jgi:uncharacterized protein YjbJ (UPF0337 family)
MERVMNEDRVAGTAKDIGGKAQEGLGRIAGDAKTELKGRLNQAEGSVQEVYGQFKEGAETAIDSAREGAVTLEEAFRNTIDQRPYTVLFGALAIGWLLGRTGRII